MAESGEGLKVVSNTSPLCHAIWIGEVEILPTLFERLVIPRAVAEELSHPGAPEGVRAWIRKPPAWLEIEAVASAPVLANLDRGEHEAISLAQQIQADLILLDEKAARRVAASFGLRVLGLVGVLEQAGHQGLLDVPTALGRLVETDFYLSPSLVERVLERFRR